MSNTLFLPGNGYLVFLKAGDSVENMLLNDKIFKQHKVLAWDQSREFKTKFADYDTKSFLEKYDKNNFWLQFYQELVETRQERKEHYELLLQENIGEAGLGNIKLLFFLYEMYKMDYDLFICETRFFGDTACLFFVKKALDIFSDKCFILTESKEYGNLKEGLKIIQLMAYNLSELPVHSIDEFDEFYMSHYQVFQKDV